MIGDSDIIAVGRVNKPHGIKGELSVTLDDDACPGFEAGQCVVMEVDGLRVPFFVGSARQRGPRAWLVKLDGIDDERAARPFTLHTLWALAKDMPDDEGDGAGEEDDGFYLADLIGYTIADARNGAAVGTIEDYDDSTPNLLFIVRAPGAGEASLLIPAADDLIEDIDPDTRTVTMDLPEGLTD